MPVGILQRTRPILEWFASSIGMLRATMDVISAALSQPASCIHTDTYLFSGRDSRRPFGMRARVWATIKCTWMASLMRLSLLHIMLKMTESSGLLRMFFNVTNVISMWKDPMMVQAVALMRAGKMPKLSVIAAGLDIMTLTTRPTRKL